MCYELIRHLVGLGILGSGLLGFAIELGLGPKLTFWTSKHVHLPIKLIENEKESFPQWFMRA